MLEMQQAAAEQGRARRPGVAPKIRKVLLLEEVAIGPQLKSVLDDFKARHAAGAPIGNGLNLIDYRRWSHVLDLIPDGSDLLDIGVGLGQFVNAAMLSGRFQRVRGADYRPHSGLQFLTDFELLRADLTRAPDLSAQIVTCMEVIEHIKTPGFDAAVDNLKKMTNERLLVTVPYAEHPLPSYHHQRFTVDRLDALFPGGEITLMAEGRTIRWALVDWRKEVQT
jgi:hypothetical protein